MGRKRRSPLAHKEQDSSPAKATQLRESVKRACQAGEACSVDILLQCSRHNDLKRGEGRRQTTGYNARAEIRVRRASLRAGLCQKSGVIAVAANKRKSRTSAALAPLRSKRAPTRSVIPRVAPLTFCSCEPALPPTTCTAGTRLGLDSVGVGCSFMKSHSFYYSAAWNDGKIRGKA